MTSVVLPEFPVVVRCACALPYAMLLKLVGRGFVAGLEILWKSRLRFWVNAPSLLPSFRFSSLVMI